jgi:hypothetical protein
MIKPKSISAIELSHIFFLVVPRRPCVAAVVRAEIEDIRARDGALESLLDARASRDVAIIVFCERRIEFAEFISDDFAGVVPTNGAALLAEYTAS